MSVHKTTNGWRVAWRDATGSQRSKRFRVAADAKDKKQADKRAKADAMAWDEAVRHAKRLGPLATQQLTSRQTMNEFVAAYWLSHARRSLAARTQRDYARSYRLWSENSVGRIAINAVTVPVLRQWLDDMESAGASVDTRKKAKTVVSSILQLATEDGVIPVNTARVLKMNTDPRPPRKVDLRPETVERIRAIMAEPMPRQVPASGRGQRKRRAYTQPDRRSPLMMHRDALLVGVLAYTGLRPSEAFALRFGDVKGKRFEIAEALDVDGSRKPTKNKKTRNVRIPAVVLADLRALKRAARATDSDLIFPGEDGLARSQTSSQNWRKRTWRAACVQAGLEKAPRLYDLRHVCVTLLFQQGASIHAIADQLGHSASMALDVYGHHVDEREDEQDEGDDAMTVMIRAARATAAARP